MSKNERMYGFDAMRLAGSALGAATFGGIAVYSTLKGAHSPEDAACAVLNFASAIGILVGPQVFVRHMENQTKQVIPQPEVIPVECELAPAE